MAQVADPSYLDILDELLGSFDGWRSFDAEGVLRMGWIEAPEDQTPDWTLTRLDVAAVGDYQTIPGGEPPRELEIEWGHISHPEQPGELAGAVEANRGRWADPSRLIKRKVPGADQIYLLSPREPYRIPARWSRAAGARTELLRVRDRVTRREGFRVPLGNATTVWFNSAMAPGDYVSISNPKAPGGTATAVVWSLRRVFATSTVEITCWGALSE